MNLVKLVVVAGHGISPGKNNGSHSWCMQERGRAQENPGLATLGGIPSVESWGKREMSFGLMSCKDAVQHRKSWQVLIRSSPGKVRDQPCGKAREEEV